MKQSIGQLLQTVLKQLKLEGVEVSVTPTQDPTHGDYATNVAFQAGKKLGKSPLVAAELIANDLRQMTNDLIEKIEVAAPGFINLTLTDKALLGELLTEHKKRASTSLEGSKIMIEFTDPNPFKEFHIGHLYNNIVGESISRLLEANGAEVRRVCYQGDVGLHVAKALWGLGQLMANSKWQIADLEKKSLDERAKFLGEAYALGATKYEESDGAKQEIIEINKVVYELNNEKYSSSEAKRSREVDDKSSQLTNVRSNKNALNQMYIKGKQWSLDYFETIYARLGTKFEDYYFESEAGPKGIDLVKQYKDTVFEESNGAIIFPGEKYGLHTRVFINSLGLPTYEAKELGLAVTKYEDYPFDSSIMITGNEIDEYFKVLLKALSLIRPEIAAKMKHLSHGMVRLPEGKMSSRTGNVKTGEWLLNEAVTRAGVLAKREAYPKSTSFSEAAQGMDDQDGVTPRESNYMRGVSPKDADEVAEMVGVGAVKWALLRSGIGKDVEFSFDESVSFEGNSGPYLQYTYVRTQSVLAKREAQRGENEENAMRLPLSAKLAREERSLLVLLCQYSDIVAQAAERYSPNVITTYLFELAQAFNLFYQKHQILKPEKVTPISPLLAGEGRVRYAGVSPEIEDATQNFRLALTQKVGQTIKDGLYLLGIPTPERM